MLTVAYFKEELDSWKLFSYTKNLKEWLLIQIKLLIYKLFKLYEKSFKINLIQSIIPASLIEFKSCGEIYLPDYYFTKFYILMCF